METGSGIIDAAEREYEFSEKQNRLFRRLAMAMKVSGLVMMAVSVLLFLVGIRVAWLYDLALVRKGVIQPGGGNIIASPTGVLFYVPAFAVGGKGIHLFRASARFNLIARTTGRDMVNLTTSLEELVKVYAVQRWIWLVCGLLLLASLVTVLAS